MKIFVDDLRMAPEKYDLIFRHGEELLDWVKENPDTHVSLLSLDHDLNEGFIDGTALCRQLVETPNNIACVQFHTDNLQGLRNMYSILKSAHKVGLLPNLRRLYPYKINCIDGQEDVMTYFDASKN